MKNISLITAQHVNASIVRIDNTVHSFDATEMKSRASAQLDEGMLMCSKFTGSLDGKPMVLRGCGFGNRTLNGTCTKSAILILDGRSASDVLACFCSAEECNGQSSSDLNETTSSDAACCQLTSYLLCTVLIYFMYKLCVIEIK